MALRADSIAKLQRRLLWTGVALLGLCVVHSSTGGYALGGDSIAKGLMYAGIMACVTIGAAILPTIADMAFRRRLAMRGAVAALACLVLTGGELYANLLAMGATRHASVATADHADTRVADRRATIADTESTIRTLEAVLRSRNESAGWLSTKPSAAWRSDIANLEGHVLYARSRQCSQVTLADSRAHCDKLAEARANLATAEAHERDAAQLVTLKTKLAEIRDRARDDAPGTSAARTQADNAVRAVAWMGGSATRDDAEFGLTMFFMLVMVFGPMALIWAAHIDWSERPARTPMSARIAGMIATLRRWRSGDLTPAPQSQPIAEPTATIIPAARPQPGTLVAQTNVRRLADLMPGAITRAA